jgi:hypothetical protein
MRYVDGESVLGVVARDDVLTTDGPVGIDGFRINELASP